MSCTPVSGPGWSGYICSRGRQPAPRCSVPGCDRKATHACDYPVERCDRAGRPLSGTCDAELCQVHARPQEPGVDYCPPHAKAAGPKQGRLF